MQVFNSYSWNFDETEPEDTPRDAPTRLPFARMTGAKFVSTIGSIPRFAEGISTGSDQPDIAVGSLLQIISVLSRIQIQQSNPKSITDTRVPAVRQISRRT